MERVYLLLRNNQQSGPFTIGELLQQQLKPNDMIWIEGKSTAWTYLSELELLPFVEPMETRTSPAIKPKDEIERKAEELRKKVLTSPPKFYTPPKVEVETYASAYKLPENEIDFVDHRREKASKNNVVVSELLLTCFVIGLFSVGIYKGRSFLAERKQAPNSAATQLVSKDQHAAQKQTSSPISSTSFDTARAQTDSSLLASGIINRPKASVNFKKQKDSLSNTVSTNTVIPEDITPSTTDKKEEQIVVPPITKSSIEPVVKKEEGLRKENTSKDNASTEVKEKNKTASEPEEKKKGFLGIFKKKKKDDDPKEN